MGESGAKQTKPGLEAADALVEALRPLGDVTSRRMFGGVGIFHADRMFAIVDSTGSAFLIAGDATIGDFERTGAVRHARMPYWSIPDEVRSSDEALHAWARRAIEVADSKR